MCTGKSNKEIARELDMAEATVKLHLTTVFKVMGVHRRAEAISRATTAEPTIPAPPLSSLAILEEFATVALTTPHATWPDRVIAFGQAIERRSRHRTTKQ